MLSHETLLAAIPHAIDTVDIPDLGEKAQGKVRDMYRIDGRRILITTDRVSAFDRVLGLIPYKGQVLNQLSAWWFEQLQDIVGNHVLSVPDPNVMIVREAEPLPVEVIVRGYITGVTKTSLWYLYSQPAMPDDFVAQVAARYIAAYEKLTGRSFEPGELPAKARIVRNVEQALKTQTM